MELTSAQLCLTWSTMPQNLIFAHNIQLWNN